MDALDYWRLCDEVSVIQAALLLLGVDPSDREYSVERKAPSLRPKGYDATRSALTNAITGKRLAATVHNCDDESGISRIDWNKTTISVEELCRWLRTRGVTSGFFFPVPERDPDYLSRLHQNYSPKLAAAVNAWKAVSANEDLRRGKTVKQAIDVWLRQNANQFGLTKEDGNPNAQGIEDVAKIANWDTRGGAPKTPSRKEPTHPLKTSIIDPSPVVRGDKGTDDIF